MRIDTQHTYLIVSKIRERLDQKGLMLKWVVGELGMSSTAGDLLLRRGVLPVSETLALKVLKKLSVITGFEVTEMIETIYAKAA